MTSESVKVEVQPGWVAPDGRGRIFLNDEQRRKIRALLAKGLKPRLHLCGAVFGTRRAFEAHTRYCNTKGPCRG